MVSDFCEDSFVGSSSSSQEIDVRAAVYEDLPDIIELAADMSIYSMSPFRHPDKEAVVRGRRDDLQSLYEQFWDPNLGLFVARNALGRLLGHCIVKIGQKEYLTGEEQAWIYDISVVPDMWGTGISKRLMECAENFAAENGMGYLGLTVTGINARALRFYQNMGYEDERLQMVKILTPVIPDAVV